MSQHMLPHTVRIKRKRQDEPVETLHVHTHDDPKKRRFNVQEPSPSYPAVFRRVLEDHNASASASTPPPGPAPTASPMGIAAAGDVVTHAEASASTAPATPSRSSSSLSAERRIIAPVPSTRRFHLSKPSASSPSSLVGGVQKRKVVATLVESKPKKTRTGAAASPLAENVAPKTLRQGGNDVEMHIDEIASERPLKRPGRAARSVSPVTAETQPKAKNGTAATAQNRLVDNEATRNKHSSLDNKKAIAVDPGLLSEMQKFAQEVEHAEKALPTPANRSHQSHQQLSPTAGLQTPQKQLKFQPKPTPRFRDRHPERFSSEKTMGMDVDDGTASDSDGEYVYDTYVRYDGPPDTLIEIDPLTATSLPPDIGVLVIRAEDQPLWETYRVGASDEEEYGMYSDEDDLSRPWGRRPAWLKNGSGEESDDD
ncbi:hypothetical protein MPH_11808 [Macrophomina phaseolina MS6]|uniref:Transcription factor Iwr1 domain-containing protein n=1 Tax=Macrophomina phaseolina (strain MS6) TaxID=1126212 RepID=K2S303_MACPH|nr:hypothetical protein MPH_11808 [Macrophomina phaseolina MS6]